MLTLLEIGRGFLILTLVFVKRYVQHDEDKSDFDRAGESMLHVLLSGAVISVGLSNHLPMALGALASMGATAERLTSFSRDYTIESSVTDDQHCGQLEIGTVQKHMQIWFL